MNAYQVSGRNPGRSWDRMASAGLTFRRGFNRRVAKIVFDVTRQKGEIYINFEHRASKDPVSRLVKRHDVQDNLDRSLAQDDDIAQRYVKALAVINMLEHEQGGQT